VTDYKKVVTGIYKILLLIILKLGDNKLWEPPTVINIKLYIEFFWYVIGLRWPYIENIHQWNKNNVYEENILNKFQISLDYEVYL
jgi:hypothetical protein